MKIRLYLSNAVMLLGQLLFLLVLKGANDFWQGQTQDPQALALAWIILGVTAFGSIFMLSAFQWKVALRSYIAVAAELAVEGVLLLVRYFMNTNARILLLLTVLAQALFLAYIYTDLMQSGRKDVK